MREANILYLVVSKFRDVDLHPDHVPNEQMGLIFENLIRRFNELANETVGGGGMKTTPGRAFETAIEGWGMAQYFPRSTISLSLSVAVS